MTMPNDPMVPTYDEAAFVSNVEPQASPPSAAEPEPTTTLHTSEASEQDDHSAASQVKATALLAGVAALANNLRQEAPKKVQEIREKRAAGRCVILAEQDGRPVAVGPYPSNEAARADTSKVAAGASVVELVPESAFFDSPA